MKPSFKKNDTAPPQNKTKAAGPPISEMTNEEIFKHLKHRDCRSKAEMLGQMYADKLSSYIHEKKGLYLRDEDGSFHVLLDGTRIPLAWDPNNVPQSKLLLRAVGVSNLENPAKAALQRLAAAASQTAGAVKLRHFSAMSEDAEQLYIPIDGGNLLRITADSIGTVPNGKNEANLWIEHPENDPLKHSATVDGKAGLDLFGQLCVDTQTCKHPDMRWLAAMQEGLFPYLRNFQPARFIAEHIGPKGSGKTSGARRFTLLNGLGDVKGDYTPAALGDIGDIGLLVMDNKEHDDFRQGLIKFCLFLATGADKGRSSPTGKVRSSQGRERPIGVITTIEGVFKPELQDRTASIEYEKPTGMFDQAKNEREILKHRHEMLSALIHVLQRSLQIQKEERTTPAPRPRFQGNFQACADWLRAYADVAEKGEGWAERIIASWSTLLTSAQCEEESELEFQIQQVVDGWADDWEKSPLGVTRTQNVTVEGVKGDLYITRCGVLLGELKKRNPHDRSLQKTAQAFGRRLKSDSFRAFRLLDEKLIQEVSGVKRRNDSKFLGIFVPSDEGDQSRIGHLSVTSSVTELSPPLPAAYKN